MLLLLICRAENDIPGALRFTGQNTSGYRRNTPNTSAYRQYIRRCLLIELDSSIRVAENTCLTTTHLSHFRVQTWIGRCQACCYINLAIGNRPRSMARTIWSQSAGIMERTPWTSSRADTAGEFECPTNSQCPSTPANTQ